MCRAILLDQLKRDLKIGLMTFNRLRFRCPRQGVTGHSLDAETRHALRTDQMSEETFRQVREWLTERNWQLSRQRVRHPVNQAQKIEYLFLAPMILVSFQTGYHATLRSRCDSIFSIGLVPGSPDRQTDNERLDCDGNIFVCHDLGVPEDAGRDGSFSAHWWCDHKSRRNRFGDPDWVILEIDLGGLPPHRLYRDIWSESGVIVGGVSVIPPALIRQVFPEEDGNGSPTKK